MFKQKRVVISLALCGLAFLAWSALSQEDPRWGDNTSEWANDGECDDPRFDGIGMASTLRNEDRFHDAYDCETLFSLGDIWLVSTSFRLGVDDRKSDDGQFVDRYQFVVPALESEESDSIYQIDLRSASLDTVLRLFAQGEDETIAFNDDYRDDVGHSHIIARLEPGYYTLEVSSYSVGETGTYGLTVKQISNVQVTPTQ